ncbi:MAG: iron-sulfur cluster assembly scaffold protein [Candidatus Babeliales bacterium]|nr:iron-sulfur cluster assembly scaffold protein [Candidatus Babeliales bacterium]
MNLYQEELMDHYRNPRNRMVLDLPDMASQEHNPSCGDSISFQGMVHSGTITQLAFDGKGCVISQGAASMLSQLCTDKTLESVALLDKEFIVTMLGIPLGPTRLKCALLPLQALQQAIAQYKK